MFLVFLKHFYLYVYLWRHVSSWGDIIEIIIKNVGNKLVVDDDLIIFLWHETITIPMLFIGHEGRISWPKGFFMRRTFLGKILCNWSFPDCNNFISMDTIFFPVGTPIFAEFISCYISPIYCFTELRVHVRYRGPFQYHWLYGVMIVDDIS